VAIALRSAAYVRGRKAYHLTHGSGRGGDAVMARCEVRDDVRNTPCAEPWWLSLVMFGATSPVPGSLAGRVPSCLHQEMWHAPQWQGFYSYRDIYLDLDPTYRDRFGRPLVRMTIDFPRQRAQAERFPDGPSCRGHKRDGGEEGVKQYRKGPYDISGCEIRAERSRPRTVRADAIPIATLKRGLMIRRNRLK